MRGVSYTSPQREQRTIVHRCGHKAPALRITTRERSLPHRSQTTSSSSNSHVATLMGPYLGGAARTVLRRAAAEGSPFRAENVVGHGAPPRLGDRADVQQ